MSFLDYNNSQESADYYHKYLNELVKMGEKYNVDPDGALYGGGTPFQSTFNSPETAQYYKAYLDKLIESGKHGSYDPKGATLGGGIVAGKKKPGRPKGSKNKPKASGLVGGTVNMYDYLGDISDAEYNRMMYANALRPHGWPEGAVELVKQGKGIVAGGLVAGKLESQADFLKRIRSKYPGMKLAEAKELAKILYKYKSKETQKKKPAKKGPAKKYKETTVDLRIKPKGIRASTKQPKGVAQSLAKPLYITPQLNPAVKAQLDELKRKEDQLKMEEMALNKKSSELKTKEAMKKARKIIDRDIGFKVKSKDGSDYFEVKDQIEKRKMEDLLDDYVKYMTNDNIMGFYDKYRNEYDDDILDSIDLIASNQPNFDLPDVKVGGFASRKMKKHMLLKNLREHRLGGMAGIHNPYDASFPFTGLEKQPMYQMKPAKKSRKGGKVNVNAKSKQALGKYNEILKGVRKANPGKSFRECQAIASKKYHK